MNIALTGAGGFLGWHTRVLAHSLGMESIGLTLGERFDADDSIAALSGVDTLIHIAGVNRGTDGEVGDGNVLFATQLAHALGKVRSSPTKVVYANSIQAGNGSPYGSAKTEAGRILAEAARACDAKFVDVRLPNLFGEHGVPFYNSVVSTFSHLLASGASPSVTDDKSLSLLHVQNAAEVLLGIHDATRIQSLATTRTVSEVAAKLQSMASTYKAGTIPDISDPFDRDLFNTYRSYLAGEKLPIVLDRKNDSRGSFFEVVRSEGGEGQSSFSTTVPGITRGQHYHRRKIERFTVLSGTAEIAMRRMFSSEVLRFRVTGDEPVSVDMPTMWSHKITNVGADKLYTMFWINEIFDPSAPDTFLEEV